MDYKVGLGYMSWTTRSAADLQCAHHRRRHVAGQRRRDPGCLTMQQPAPRTLLAPWTLRLLHSLCAS
jgi:hypothetical protein